MARDNEYRTGLALNTEEFRMLQDIRAHLIRERGEATMSAAVRYAIKFTSENMYGKKEKK